MINKVLCKTCMRFKDPATTVTRFDASGRKKVRCAECVANIKAAKK